LQFPLRYTTLIQVTPNDKRAGPPERPPEWRGIDHVQLAMPAGQEDVARRFYRDLLGIPEVPKPPLLAARGGCWFETGAVRVHLGVDDEFRPARKAHPALVVADLAATVARLGLDVTWADDIPGVARCHLADPFGNRIELIDGGHE
jgi:catechol 2,3-dioxygenase-like lactoylglutathione lyase family enzyme